MGEEITIRREIDNYSEAVRDIAYAELDKKAAKRGVKLKGKSATLLKTLEDGSFLYEFSGEIAEAE